MNAAVGETGEDGVVRLRLDLAYDGTYFVGWAVQPGHRSVQGVLEETLSLILRHPARLTVAGRTDAGVHAAGQVAHVDVSVAAWEEYSTSLVRRLARLLPHDVRVTSITRAPSGFDARFSALFRVYEYRVTDNPWGASPLRRYDTLAWHKPLNIEAMTQASSGLLGEHDFRAFCRSRLGATTIRALERLNWRREPDGVAVATVRADAFCHSMVRSIVGALIAVGEGRKDPSWPAKVLAARGRTGEIVVAPARGLTLMSVGYPSDDRLAARAEQTRRLRTGLLDVESQP